MSVLHMLSGADPVASRVDWTREPNVISARVENGDLVKAAAALEHTAKHRGMNITEVARVAVNGVEAVFARGA